MNPVGVVAVIIIITTKSSRDFSSNMEHRLLTRKWCCLIGGWSAEGDVAQLCLRADGQKYYVEDLRVMKVLSSGGGNQETWLIKGRVEGGSRGKLTYGQVN
jgi:hypothetical protein